MVYKLATKEIGENSSYAIGKNLDISIKESKEVCSFVRNMRLGKALKMLEEVIKKERSIPFKKYNDDMAHKPGISSGRYPIKCASQILKIIKSAENNAQNKGLSSNDLVITHMCAHKASSPWHYGRQRRRKMKRSHVEIVLTEIKEKKKVESKEISKEKETVDKKPRADKK